MRTRTRRKAIPRDAGRYALGKYGGQAGELRGKERKRGKKREKEGKRERVIRRSVLGVAGCLIERGFPWARVDIRANEAFPRKPGGGLSYGEGLRHQWGC